MSKAFTREPDGEDTDDGDAVEDKGSAPLPARNYMTRAGYDRLQAELNQLWNVERPEVVRVVSWAASNGDRSENGDYLYGKRRLREIDRRVRFLNQRLEAAIVVDPGQQSRAGDQVFFGATVRYADRAGSQRMVTIVGVDEVDPLAGRISWISPVAKALLKSRVGDVVVVQTPAGEDELEVLDIGYH
jgi:transcription elongation factor GreB